MKEITIISGKGGTGKTSVTASFAFLAKNRVVVDADVDAANLFLTLPHKIIHQESFIGGRLAKIDPAICTECGECRERCQFDAISADFIVDPIACEGCKVCVHYCPVDAILFEQQTCGERFLSETDNGPMVHAKLGIAQENSGMLVSLLRQQAREIAKKEKIPLIIVDGPPGIGCPVIASITNADAILIVTEPSMSGMHDMERVKLLADQMRIPALLCINKADLNQEKTDDMKAFALANNIIFAGEIPFDREVTASMNAGKSLAEFSRGAAAQAVEKVWQNVLTHVNKTMDRLI